MEADLPLEAPTSPHGIPPQLRPRRPTPRRFQKEATRQRVLEAAGELFDTLGYDGATVREIARHAGVSVGSVFTTFAAKGEILSEVMQERFGPLYAELDRVAPLLRGSTVDRLRSLFAILIAFQAARPKLFLAYVMAAYDWTLPPGAKPFGHNVRLRTLILDCLRKGVEEGDVDPQVDLGEVMELLVAAYGWSWRLAVTDAADAAALTAVMDRRIGMIAATWRR